LLNLASSASAEFENMRFREIVDRGRAASILAVRDWRERLPVDSDFPMVSVEDQPVEGNTLVGIENSPSPADSYLDSQEQG
jgi:hypothetical protein